MKREMGGNGAAIVLEDADPQTVARMIGRHTNQHFGQTCCTIHRVFVAEKIADDFIDAQREFFSDLKIGYQADEGTQLGAVINSMQHTRILAAQKEAVTRGGQPILSGGTAEVADREGYYIKPAIYRASPELNCNPDEVFHAFATICPVTDSEQALKLANSTPYGLGVASGQRTSHAVWNWPAIPRRNLSGELPQYNRLRTAYAGQASQADQVPESTARKHSPTIQNSKQCTWQITRRVTLATTRYCMRTTDQVCTVLAPGSHEAEFTSKVRTRI